MARFRKRPIEVEAWQIGGAELVPQWLTDALTGGVIVPCGHRTGAIDINTIEGTMHASTGDWIIRGIAGELDPCKPDIFAETYEALDG